MARATRNFTWVVDRPLDQMSNMELYEAQRDRDNPRKSDAAIVLIRRLKSRKSRRRK